MKKFFKRFVLFLTLCLLIAGCTEDDVNSVAGIWASSNFPDNGGGMAIYQLDGTVSAYYWVTEETPSQAAIIKGTYTKNESSIERNWNFTVNSGVSVPRTSTVTIISLTETVLKYSMSSGAQSNFIKLENSEGIVGAWIGGGFPETFSDDNENIAVFKPDGKYFQIGRNDSNDEPYFVAGTYSYDGTTLSLNETYDSNGTLDGSITIPITISADLATTPYGIKNRIK